MKKLSDIAFEIGGKLMGNPDEEIIGVKPISDAKKGDITFLLDKKYKSQVENSEATACITICEIANIPNQILVQNPKASLVKTLNLFAPNFESFTADYISNPEFENVFLGPNTLIGKNTTIQKNTKLLGNITIGTNCSIGENCLIHPNVVLYNNIIIGNNVTIHSGAVIGADGFGYYFENGIHNKIPQIGTVIIQDNVEIGANSSIDRGCIGNTIISTGSKIDNLVQIGHNAFIGNHCIVVSQAGIGGSAKLGNYVTCAAQAAISAISVGNKVTIAAKSGVTKNIPDGSIISGFPAWDHRKETKKEAWLRQNSQGRKNNETI